jgi:D-alanyl-lipoteichoic acid acyltransferase DltB (MBOAT superfamily)
MGFIQIGASILTALLIGALTRGARTLRMYLLLAFSVLAVYWFQPALPIRSFDFWLPSLSLALTVLTWLVTSPTSAHADAGSSIWRSRPNLIGLSIMVGLATLIDVSRYFLPDPILTATTPPQFIQYLLFIAILTCIVSLLLFFSRRFTWTWSFAIILIITILLILKSPTLSLQTSIFIRTLANRPIENAAFTDLRWLGFSYIAFRLIHVLHDKQMGRLPELSLPEFSTYVVFFPSLAAGPIDRAERFADLRRFYYTQDETLLQDSAFSWLFKKFCYRGCN